jgi:cation diffusion facilitator family transporter
VRFGRRFEFPKEQQEQRRRAKRLAWLSIVLITSAATFLAFASGQSQAMKTAWVSDLLGLVPPVALLVAMHFELKEPTERFPYGYFRAVTLAFLVTAVVLGMVGVWLFVDSVMKLVRQERPPIGSMELFGYELWAGWPMIVALVYAVALDMLIGYLKRPVAEKLHDKALEADADMNRADWLSQGSAIVGILLVGYGFWWGDAVAAGIISLNIIRDGWHNLHQVLADLMDETPTKMGGKDLEELPRKIKDAAERMDWVEKAAVRLREQGHVLAGDVFVVPRVEKDLVAHIEQAADDLLKLDWRLYGLTVMPVSSLEAQAPPRPGGDGRAPQRRAERASSGAHGAQ